MTRLAIDMSSYIKTALLAGKDEKDGTLVMFEDKQVLVNSAEYGYENFTNMMLRTLTDTGIAPKACLLVFEGLSSKSRRLLFDPLYKSKRDKKPPEFYEEFQRLREFVERQWLGLGAIAVCQDYAEGDDTLGFLAENIEEDLIVASRDSDLGVLNFVNAHGAKIETWNDGLRGIPKADSEPFVHPPKYLTLYKALVGDTSDSIPGCKGFGPAAFQKLAEQYGYDGLDEMMGLLQAGSLGPVHELAEHKEHKLLKKIVEQEAEVIKAWKLVRLYPEWVNTMKSPLRIQGGKITNKPVDLDKRLEDFYSQEWLVTAENYEASLEFFKENMHGPEVVFDIETSTPDESDEWIGGIPRGKGAKGDKVDQLGSVLTGFSFTFGKNNEFTMYVSVDHANTDNIKSWQARRLMEAALDAGKKIVIHNNFFELSVLAMQQDEDGTPWLQHWEKYGAHGFMPNSLDTKFEASYVNENISNGLKFRSKHHLGYEQQTFQQTTQLTGHPDTLPPGGKLIEVLEFDTVYATPEQLATMELGDMKPEDVFENVPTLVTRQYKMRELTAEHVTAYGCDDTICTAALHNLFMFVMQIEHTWQVYLDTEIDASYQHVKNFLDGMPFSLEKMRELEKLDDDTFDHAWVVVREYLIKQGWTGTVPPVYDTDISAKQIKEAYRIVTGFASKIGIEIEDLGGEGDEDGDETEEAAEEVLEGEADESEAKDPFLASKVRTPAKLVVLARELGHEVFASMLERCLAGEHEQFTAWVQEHFSGEPLFKVSNKQMCKLLYEVMGLPVKVRNKATKVMRAKGIKEGNPKGDILALEYGLRDGTLEQKAVIEGIKLMTMVRTRRSLYYSKYPHMVHWKTGRIHPTHNQCQTNTRRASEGDPNKQQMPKHPKITGQPSRFRETIVPHHKDAVIVSLDFDSQELRVIADYSKDENMVACFVGDNKKSMHSLTGHSIALRRRKVEVSITYEEFNLAAKDKNHPLHEVCVEHRALGKKVNFTTEFGAMAPKLAMTMLCTEEEAQAYIDAKEAMFPGVRHWKDGTVAEAKRCGYVRTMGGAMRHLRDSFLNEDYWIVSKAERQSVNFKVQGSSAEMTKRAEGRMWRMGLVYKYGCVCIGPIHDEVVFSVHKDQLLDFLKDAHWCMTQPYGGMEIPIESSISFGPSFGEQYEIGIKPTAEAVAEGWRQINEAAAKAAAINKAKESSNAVTV